MNRRRADRSRLNHPSLTSIRARYLHEVNSNRIMDQKSYCALRKKAVSLAGGILFSNGTTFAVLLALTQALLFLTTKSFWPVAVFVVARITSLTETSSQFLQDYGDGIVPIGFVLIALSVIFVAFMLHPYIDKRHQARSSSEFLEKPWCASKIWRWVNYFLLFAASATSFISLSYVAEGSSTLSALWSPILLLILATMVFHCLFLIPKAAERAYQKILLCATPTIFALLQPVYPRFFAGFLFEPLPLLLIEIIFLTTLFYATCWFFAIGSFFLPTTPQTSKSNNNPKEREFTWWLLRDGIIGCVLFVLGLVELFLLALLIALVASFPFMGVG
ncbi:hypothetical protein BR46_002348 [Adlercreutzia equolifaciens subsp. celatus DSM 18785]|mgnify:FL=1|nr:hypothetical protein [Adlercreutzia equolifaciens subsp. celatus DSM 18785]